MLWSWRSSRIFSRGCQWDMDLSRVGLIPLMLRWGVGDRIALIEVGDLPHISLDRYSSISLMRLFRSLITYCWWRRFLIMFLSKTFVEYTLLIPSLGCGGPNSGASRREITICCTWCSVSSLGLSIWDRVEVCLSQLTGWTQIISWTHHHPFCSIYEYIFL